VIPAAPNSWRWKAPRPSGKRCPSRGDVGTRASVGPRGRRDNPALRTKDRRQTRQTSRGARVAYVRRGTFAHVVLRQQAAGGEVLRSELLGPCSPAPLSNGHRQAMVGSRRRPQAASRLVGGSRDRLWRRACSAVCAVSGGLSRLAVFVILLREGKGAVRCSLTRAGTARTRATSGTLRHAGLRFSENRMLSGVSVRRNSLQKSFGGSRIQRSACRRSV